MYTSKLYRNHTHLQLASYENLFNLIILRLHAYEVLVTNYFKMETFLMKDVQAEIDRRGKLIHKVGVRNVRTLVRFDECQFWANISSYITLEDFQRGAHMSRFIEVLDKVPQTIDKPAQYLRDYLYALCTVHNAKEAFLKVRTSLPLCTISPVSNKTSLRHIPCELEGEKHLAGYKCFVRIKMFVTSPCPCSKDISEYGAHNQRAMIDVRVQIKNDIDLSDFMYRLSMLGSSPIHELLKRPDEKFVTEAAFENPKFCEDIARDVSLEVDKMRNITDYSVVVESEESIHDHNALAIIDHFKFA